MASICTSAVPAGQPEPRRETPTTLTFEGTTDGTLKAREELTEAGTAAARGRMALRSEIDFMMKGLIVDAVVAGWNEKSAVA